ncbi:hypothetical protein FC62_GL000713 [Amylolactobacillus amylotrophicus DSM 20534]|nr:hypothetical protein FC62_GL000713 [Amylolactobacillus amylotrophicus DSM 20534]KRM42206.1 hypothetical protein FD40_GL000992 [Amylolactobacillus amylophilus DSM 20533 = JCM 1125]
MQENWEKITQQVRYHYDAKKMKKFIQANLPDYQFKNVLLDEPYSKPYYWQKNGGRWVAVMPHGKKLFYIQNKYEEGGRKVKTPLGQRLVNMIFMIFFH